MRRPILLLIIMAIAFSQSDILSPNILNGVLFPLLFSAALLVLLIWLIGRSRGNRRGDGGSGDAGGGYYYGGKSGDGGSGDAGGDGGGD
ncbi:hypothetical protein [Cellvibrio sp. pealriver]|uniref:hypothetical protein n=1 Tax=Cellvibrio sp. pealriver TaxID=1622269 RepID=UPI00066FD53D|nr:hypothetical protein [Cellvibrio sp. pealriver]